MSKESEVNVEIETEVNEIFIKSKVNQELINIQNDPIEVKIEITKYPDIIFSSFLAQIGNSTIVKSKLLKKEKAEEKYEDSIASGNAAIFVSEDTSRNIIIINIGNIPPKEKVIFISEFIQNTKYSKKIDMELFRNLPFFKGNNILIKNKHLKGKILIKTQKDITNVKKDISNKNIKIIEEKYINNSKNNYLIIYEINAKHIGTFVNSSKIFFEIGLDEPLIYSQKLSNSSEKIYILQHIFTGDQELKKISFKPALFIFLLDQSGSMEGESIKISCNSLKIFLQSIPKGSYYQIIGFGSIYKKYSEKPLSYIENNIQSSLKQIDLISADLGGTNLYEPLKDIYDSKLINEVKKLPKNIILLTDGALFDKEKTLQLIEKNNSDYYLYSIGIGNNYDLELIKSAGLLGKGSYYFCDNISNLNSTISNLMKEALCNFISNPIVKIHNFKCEFLNDISKVIRSGDILRLDYLSKEKQDDNKMNIEIKYELEKEEKIINYSVVPIEFPGGNDLFKLAYNNFINEDKNRLSENDKLNLSLKYEIFNKYTSLFAHIELSGIIKEQLKAVKPKEIDYKSKRPEKPIQLSNNTIKKLFTMGKVLAKDDMKLDVKSDMMQDILDALDEGNDEFDEENDKQLYEQILLDVGINPYDEEEGKEDKNKEEEQKNQGDNQEKEDNLDKMLINKKVKEEVMEIIRQQNFLEGYWELNDKTKIVKNQFEKEYNLLIKLKSKEIKEKVAMTILIIYYINKKFPSLLNELIIIIEKGKLYIQNEIKSSYEKILKESGISDN